MSNEFSIAGVTVTLRNLLDAVKDISDPGISGNLPSEARPTNEIVINNLPLDQAYDFDDSKNQINVFLYHVEHNPEWRNMPIPGQAKNGETGTPPLGLNLYYIITAYGQNKNEIIGHLLLGKAMSILHDHPVFSKEELKLSFEDSELHTQVERIRITPQPLSLEDNARLWTGFQTQYKLSVAYQVAVLLIESKRKPRTPLPVLTRGKGDAGILVQPYVIPAYPTLESLQYPPMQTVAQPGDELILKGHNLKADSVSIIFKHLATGLQTTLAATGTPADMEIKCTIPSAPSPGTWLAGSYLATAILHTATQPDKKPNNIPVNLAPVINNIVIAPVSPKTYKATIAYAPVIQPGQQVLLLLSDKSFSPVDPAAAGSLEFLMKEIDPGDYYLRLRIDGVDSVLIDNTLTPPVYKAAVKKTIV